MLVVRIRIISLTIIYIISVVTVIIIISTQLAPFRLLTNVRHFL